MLFFTCICALRFYTYVFGIYHFCPFHSAHTWFALFVLSSEKKVFVNYIVHDVLECEQEVPGRRGTDTETNRGSSAPSSSLANNTYIVIKIVHELLKI